MQKANYEITGFPEKTLVQIRLSGFFLDVEVLDFKIQLQGILRSHAWGFGRHNVLCDITEMQIQAQSVVAMFSEVANEPALRSKRLAFIVGSSLARMQAQRLTTRSSVEFFSAKGDAEEWLALRTVV